MMKHSFYQTEQEKDLEASKNPIGLRELAKQCRSKGAKYTRDGRSITLVIDGDNFICTSCTETLEQNIRYCLDFLDLFPVVKAF